MRLFFALWPESQVVAELSALAQGAARRWGGRATRPETLHLTLAFLGEVAVERLPAVLEAASGVEADHFAIRFDRLGYWPHNHLLWAGCTEVDAALRALAEDLAQRLRAQGFRLEDRRFVPHMTLVRKMIKPPDRLPAVSAMSWNCREFVLVRSLSVRGGVDYNRLAAWALGTGE
ncbi:MAG: 2-5 ligase [Proteobacteria bacterium]|nr:2-5 ligase [Pseudomonadota bacterium]